MKPYENQILIERYMNGDMDNCEKTGFEKMLAGDPELQDELTLYKEVCQALDEIAFREKLEITTRDYMENEYPKDEFRRRVFQTIAISGPVFAACIISWLLLFNRSTTDGLYDDNFSVYPVFSTVRSAAPAGETFGKAAAAYNTEHYEEAAKHFQQAVIENEKDMEAAFYAGISFMKTRDFNKAGEYFDQVISDNDNRLVQLSCWYRALVYLKQNKINEAKTLLAKIAGLHNEKSMKAKEMLFQLEK